MKYLFQFTIIVIITFLAEILVRVLPFTIPASIYGIILMFLCLFFKIVKLEHVELAADFLLQVMPIMFVPATVNLMTKWNLIKSNIVWVLVICIVSTILVMIVTGLVSQTIINIMNVERKE
ncbi:CidA/LrgA family protein [Clostridium sp. PL3]|uniref:CidA/LrgA family protein n=1 Tax=Clostridium thailandense TaxID=2794346 RepID=A0A949TZP4_9CLOT|nr:CidA/LrgA family protein [Clostridium thailandense]MBV7276641.1 CidA/LrgA family protein [Clostridium thailandense]